MIYRARREPILIGVLVVDGIITLGVAGWMLVEAFSKRWPPVFYGVAPSLIASFVVAAWMILRSTYEIVGGNLIVAQGPSRRTIPIATIDEVFPTQNSLGTPSWARNKLQVLFVPDVKTRPLFLDPEDREALLRGLAEADSGLTFDGQKVTRGAPI